jgi:hypothetical protein
VCECVCARVYVYMSVCACLFVRDYECVCECVCRGELTHHEGLEVSTPFREPGACKTC